MERGRSYRNRIPQKQECPFVVDWADFKETRMLDENQNFIPRIAIGEAKEKAKDLGLDLVCFNLPSSNALAFCKILDFGKWEYQEEKSKKKQKHDSNKGKKEIRFSMSIDTHDIEHKIKQAKEFFAEGDDVTFTMRLKGRQRAHFSEAKEKMDEIVAMCSEEAKELSRKESNTFISVRLGASSKK